MSQPSRRKSRKQKARTERLRVSKHLKKKMKKTKEKAKVLAETVDTYNKGQVTVTNPDSTKTNN